MERIGIVNSRNIDFHVFLDAVGYVWWSDDYNGKMKGGSGQRKPIENMSKEYILSIAKEMLKSVGK